MHPKIERVMTAIRSGNLSNISRWDVMNRVNEIVSVCDDEGLLTDEVYDYLINLNDSALDSI